jgi:hypothetical protein
MNWEKLQAESEAMQSLVSLYDLARKTQQLYDRAKLPLPARLYQFLSSAEDEKRVSRSAIQLPRPSDRVPPDVAGDDWLWVGVRESTPSTLIPALLRSGPENGQVVIDRVQDLNPQVIRGSIYNTASRLVKDKVITRNGGEWTLGVAPETVPLIQGDVVWGPESFFQVQEKAAHRREAILYILQQYETGLMVVQLVEQLKNCTWMKAPANKDLLKDDVKKLFAEGKIRKVGNTQKWALILTEKGENSKAE